MHSGADQGGDEVDQIEPRLIYGYIIQGYDQCQEAIDNRDKCRHRCAS